MYITVFISNVYRARSLKLANQNSEWNPNYWLDGMGDAASTLISGPTEEALREAAQEEVQQLTKVFTKIFMVSLVRF